MMTKKNCSKLPIGKSSIKPIHHPKRNYDKILLYQHHRKITLRLQQNSVYPFHPFRLLNHFKKNGLKSLKKKHIFLIYNQSILRKLHKKSLIHTISTITHSFWNHLIHNGIRQCRLRWRKIVLSLFSIFWFIFLRDLYPLYMNIIGLNVQKECKRFIIMCQLPHNSHAFQEFISVFYFLGYFFKKFAAFWKTINNKHAIIQLSFPFLQDAHRPFSLVPWKQLLKQFSIFVKHGVLVNWKYKFKIT